MATAAPAKSASDPISNPVRYSVSGIFGVTTVANGNRWVRIASAAGSSINRLPEVETITGSSTTLVTSYFFNNPAIATTDASVGNIPNFTASTPISSNTAAICAATISAGTL